MRKSILTVRRRRRSSRFRAPWMLRSSFPRSARPTPCRAGAWGLRSATRRLIGALARVKSYLDYGAFTPVQVAAAAALNGPQDCVDEIRAILQEAGAIVWSKHWSACRLAQFPLLPATMFAWAPIPESYQAVGSLEFSKLLLEKAQVAVSPGIGFGEYGEGHVRQDRAGRERAAHPPGGAQHQEIPIRPRRIDAQRNSACIGAQSHALIVRHERDLETRNCRPGTVGVGVLKLLQRNGGAMADTGMREMKVCAPFAQGTRARTAISIFPNMTGSMILSIWRAMRGSMSLLN